MKYILIKGAKNAGKSTTLDAICKDLKPSRVSKLAFFENAEKIEVPYLEEIDNLIKLVNDTYIIEVNAKNVLIVCGSPSEQSMKITYIIDVLIRMEINIDFALVAMRSFERTDGFNTEKELENIGEALLIDKIYKINDIKFNETSEWKNRIQKYVQLISDNI